MRDNNFKILFITELLIIIFSIILFGWLTLERNTIWKDDLSLWSDVVKKSPDKARGYNEIGMYYYEKRIFDKAIPFLKKTLFLNPDHSKAHNNLGLCFLGQGSVNQAIEEFQKAIQIHPLDGMYHINLGIAYWEKGLYSLANREIMIGKDLRRKQKKQYLHDHPQIQ
jgi:tetratricopeptide (TPR) repeat protein